MDQFLSTLQSCYTQDIDHLDAHLLDPKSSTFLGHQNPICHGHFKILNFDPEKNSKNYFENVLFLFEKYLVIFRKVGQGNTENEWSLSSDIKIIGNRIFSYYSILPVNSLTFYRPDENAPGPVQFYLLFPDNLLMNFSIYKLTWMGRGHSTSTATSISNWLEILKMKTAKNFSKKYFEKKFEKNFKNQYSMTSVMTSSSLKWHNKRSFHLPKSSAIQKLVRDGSTKSLTSDNIKFNSLKRTTNNYHSSSTFKLSYSKSAHNHRQSVSKIFDSLNRSSNFHSYNQAMKNAENFNFKNLLVERIEACDRAVQVIQNLILSYHQRPKAVYEGLFAANFTRKCLEDMAAGTLNRSQDQINPILKNFHNKINKINYIRTLPKEKSKIFYEKLICENIFKNNRPDFEKYLLKNFTNDRCQNLQKKSKRIFPNSLFQESRFVYSCFVQIAHQIENQHQHGDHDTGPKTLQSKFTLSNNGQICLKNSKSAIDAHIFSVKLVRLEMIANSKMVEILFYDRKSWQMELLGEANVFEFIVKLVMLVFKNGRGAFFVIFG